MNNLKSEITYLKNQVEDKNNQIYEKDNLINKISREYEEI